MLVNSGHVVFVRSILDALTPEPRNADSKGAEAVTVQQAEAVTAAGGPWSQESEATGQGTDAEHG